MPEEVYGFDQGSYEYLRRMAADHRSSVGDISHGLPAPQKHSFMPLYVGKVVGGDVSALTTVSGEDRPGIGQADVWRWFDATPDKMASSHLGALDILNFSTRPIPQDSFVQLARDPLSGKFFALDTGPDVYRAQLKEGLFQCDPESEGILSGTFELLALVEGVWQTIPTDDGVVEITVKAPVFQGVLFPGDDIYCIRRGDDYWAITDGHIHVPATADVAIAKGEDGTVTADIGDGFEFEVRALSPIAAGEDILLEFAFCKWWAGNGGIKPGCAIDYDEATGETSVDRDALVSSAPNGGIIAGSGTCDLAIELQGDSCGTILTSGNQIGFNPAAAIDPETMEIVTVEGCPKIAAKDQTPEIEGGCHVDVTETDGTFTIDVSTSGMAGDGLKPQTAFPCDKIALDTESETFEEGVGTALTSPAGIAGLISALGNPALQAAIICLLKQVCPEFECTPDIDPGCELGVPIYGPGEAGAWELLDANGCENPQPPEEPSTPCSPPTCGSCGELECDPEDKLPIYQGVGEPPDWVIGSDCDCEDPQPPSEPPEFPGQYRFGTCNDEENEELFCGDCGPGVPIYLYEGGNWLLFKTCGCGTPVPPPDPGFEGEWACGTCGMGLMSAGESARATVAPAPAKEPCKGCGSKLTPAQRQAREKRILDRQRWRSLNSKHLGI